MHGNLKYKDQKYFTIKAATKIIFNVSVSLNTLLASYKIAYHATRCKKLHTIAEELILPAATDILSIMADKNAT